MITFLLLLYVQNCYNKNSYYKKSICILMIQFFSVIGTFLLHGFHTPFG